MPAWCQEYIRLTIHGFNDYPHITSFTRFFNSTFTHKRLHLNQICDWTCTLLQGSTEAGRQSIFLPRNKQSCSNWNEPGREAEKPGLSLLTPRDLTHFSQVKMLSAPEWSFALCLIISADTVKQLHPMDGFDLPVKESLCMRPGAGDRWLLLSFEEEGREISGPAAQTHALSYCNPVYCSWPIEGRFLLDWDKITEKRNAAWILSLQSDPKKEAWSHLQENSDAYIQYRLLDYG